MSVMRLGSWDGGNCEEWCVGYIYELCGFRIATVQECNGEEEL